MHFRPLTRWIGALALVGLGVFVGWRGLQPPPEKVVVGTGHFGVLTEPAVALDLEVNVLDQVPFPLENHIRRGDTLDRVLQRAGVSDSELYQASAAVSEVLDPRKLRARDPVFSLVRPGGELVAINLPRRGQGVVVAERTDGVWSSRYRPFRRARVRRSVVGELRGPLETSIRRAGGPPSLAYNMARVLQWDLDFNRDLRVGDRFEILYDELLLDGKVEGIAAIYALRYRNRERWVEAYRFRGDEVAGETAAEAGLAATAAGAGRYYDGEGQPLRRQFLRSPLPYSRVTSRFSLNRFHPILKRRMPHYGVDYGAPVGTAVRATADGTVVSAGSRGGAGRMVRLRHANGYVTSYLHLSGYAEGIRSGRRVQQGQVVGYVGSSGLSTGPHLDYRVQRNGRWINPATLVNEPVPPLADALLPAFLQHRDALRRELRGADSSVVGAGP